MTFLFKMAFWLGLVLVLLPTGAKKQTDTPQLDAAQAATAATAAVADVSQFCTRQPGTCSVGSQVAGIIAQRAQDGAAMVYEFITERREATPDKSRAAPARHDRADTTGSIDPDAVAPAFPRPRPARGQDTLTSSDRRPAWRAPELVREARLGAP